MLVVETVDRASSTRLDCVTVSEQLIYSGADRVEEISDSSCGHPLQR